MKQFKFIFLFVSFIALGAFYSSCGHKSHKHNHETSEANADKTGIEYSSKYICPMHCEGSGSADAGECPVCGMDYVLNEDHEAEAKEEENHDGHNH